MPALFCLFASLPWQLASLSVQKIPGDDSHNLSLCVSPPSPLPSLSLFLSLSHSLCAHVCLHFIEAGTVIGPGTSLFHLSSPGDLLSLPPAGNSHAHLAFKAWEPKLCPSCFHPKFFLSLADLCDVLTEMTLSGTPSRCHVLLVRKQIQPTCHSRTRTQEVGIIESRIFA